MNNKIEKIIMCLDGYVETDDQFSYMAGIGLKNANDVVISYVSPFTVKRLIYCHKTTSQGYLKVIIHPYDEEEDHALSVVRRILKDTKEFKREFGCTSNDPAGLIVKNGYEYADEFENDVEGDFDEICSNTSIEFKNSVNTYKGNLITLLAKKKSYGDHYAETDCIGPYEIVSDLVSVFEEDEVEVVTLENFVSKESYQRVTPLDVYRLMRRAEVEPMTVKFVDWLLGSNIVENKNFTDEQINQIVNKEMSIWMDSSIEQASVIAVWFESKLNEIGFEKAMELTDEDADKELDDQQRFD